MNKLLLGITLSYSLVFSGITAQASEVTTEAETNATEEISLEVGAGINPGSPFYFLDKGIEDLRLWLASEDKDAKLMLQFAEERLAELEELDEEDLEQYGDKLYEAYGKNLEKVNEIVAKKVASGDSKAEQMKEKLVKVSKVDAAVTKLENISSEIKDKIKQVQTKSFAISIATNLEQTELDSLKEQGFGYGEILKLKAFAELSGQTIEELTFLDIYTEDEAGNKEVDFGKLAIELGMVQLDENGEPVLDDEGQVKPDLSAIKDQFKQYQEVVKESQKQLNEAKKDKLEKIKEEVEARKEEVKKEIKEKVTLKLQERLEDFDSKVESVYQQKLAIIHALDESVLSSEQKATVIAELDVIKAELIVKLEEKVNESIKPGDLGKLNAEIHKAFNQFMEELESNEELDLEEIEEQVKEDVNNNMDALFTEVLNSPLFRLAAEISGSEFEAFQNYLMESKDSLLSEIDSEDRNDQIKRELMELFLEQLEDFYTETTPTDEVNEEVSETPVIEEDVKETPVSENPVTEEGNDTPVVEETTDVTNN
jgi:DNA repair exonuclease SbcCD ATPase subunit